MASVVPDPRLDRLRAICHANEIRRDFVVKLRQLEGFDIVFLADDSGSMSTPTEPVGKTADPFARQATRWSELQNFVQRVVDLAACLDPDGIDLRFLNRGGFSNVTSLAQVQNAFLLPPAGLTPLTVAVRSVLAEKTAREKKLLLIIATDGQPTNALGDSDVPEFTHVMATLPPNVYVSIVACTDDDVSVGYLNRIDATCARVYTNDDYMSERKEVLRAQGATYAFSFGDYLVKCLLGPIDPQFDSLDEPAVGCGCWGT